MIQTVKMIFEKHFQELMIIFTWFKCFKGIKMIVFCLVMIMRMMSIEFWNGDVQNNGRKYLQKFVVLKIVCWVWRQFYESNLETNEICYLLAMIIWNTQICCKSLRNPVVWCMKFFSATWWLNECDDNPTKLNQIVSIGVFNFWFVFLIFLE